MSKKEDKKGVKTVVVMGRFTTKIGDQCRIFETAEFGPKCHYKTAHELIHEVREMHRMAGWAEWVITDVVIG